MELTSYKTNELPTTSTAALVQSPLHHFGVGDGPSDKVANVLLASKRHWQQRLGRVILSSTSVSAFCVIAYPEI